MTDTAAAAPPRLSLVDRVYGGVAAIAIVLALWFLVRGGPSDTSSAAGRPPRITIVDPRPGATVDQPLTVTFDARAPLRPDGTDSTASRHVHVDVGATMLMPGATDVRRVAGTTYRWRLPSLPAGPASIRVYWSDANHRAIPGAASDSISVTLR